MAPLVLLGGMGPAAGADGFIAACERFGSEREIVLYQACDVPCRTSALLAEQPEPARAMVLDALEAAMLDALACLSPSGWPATLLVLCNTAHAFLPEAVARIERREPRTTPHFRWLSLVESAVMAARRAGMRRMICLNTTGTRAARLYARRFEEEGIVCIEPGGTIHASLMCAIMSGVKAFDDDVCAEAGGAFFRALIRSRPRADALVAGCTEIPRMIRSVLAGGDRRIADFLSRLVIIDPLDAALNRIRSISPSSFAATGPRLGTGLGIIMQTG